MDYLYENLGDERFQEFCSSLISKEFPNAQIFPTGQPDGGRDTIVYNSKNNKKEFIVFQVKFVKNPNQSDIHKWLVDIMAKEAPKINKLIERGATNYYLLTNVRGTAHLDNGTIDKLNKILDKEIVTPSMCWWRDDLSRRLEADSTFKWSFPEIINGQDMLNSILFYQFNDAKEKRENIVRSYLADQYEIDNEVKFKQIELQTSLLEIFTDVPIRVKKYSENNRYIRSIIYTLERYRLSANGEDTNFYYDEDEINIGAASFLLSSQVQNKLQRILLEGGPGQGKSTISQYICQVHRVKLMNKESDMLILPESLKKIPVRLPIKIDLRDIAEWVENRNPYVGSINDDYFNKVWSNSLESFLLIHFYYHSKFSDISSNDLINILKFSPILIVFDGFDEIANIESRKEVILFINKGLNRLSESSKSIQVLVTSRPAAFSNAIGFSSDTYPHFELSDMTPSTTKEYVDKWTISRKLNQRDASSIKKLIDDKLKLPHLKDLAKSPMQLAILLSLLNTRGESLPNKRTALYDSYIELFFNRESEKSTMIRDNRDLIIDIHQYLAWLLHSEAQLLKNSGRIEIDVLNERLKKYLQKEGHKTEIAETLFDVMKERVCALVSRIQGTFEFEVQPLREYFCAKFLYNTSPYSPSGSEKSGTKTDRFEAISRDAYWQNVARFFAGCLDKGELPMLIMKLNELQDNSLFKYTNHPRILTSQLLSDWVFSQYPNLLKSVVKIITNGLNVGGILNQDEKFSNEPISLPIDCGRQEVVEQCFNDLKKFPSNDYALELILLLKNNPYEILKKWEEFALQLHGEKLTLWFRYGYLLQIIYRVNPTILWHIIKNNNVFNRERVQLSISGRADESIYKIDELKEYIFSEILDSNISFGINSIRHSALNYLSTITNTYLYTSFLSSDYSHISLKSYIDRDHYRHIVDNFSISKDEIEIEDLIDKNIYNFYTSMMSVTEIEIDLWKISIEPWDFLVEKGKDIFGYNWSFCLISIIASSIKNKNERYEAYHQLNDDTFSLCKRVRYARLKSGNAKWWDLQLATSTYIEFHLLILFTWGTPSTFENLIDILSNECSKLSQDQLIKIISGMRKVARVSLFSSMQQKQIIKIIESRSIPDEIKYLFSFRFSEEQRKGFIYKHVNEYPGVTQQILDIKLEYLIKKYISVSHDSELLKEIKGIYSRTTTFNEKNFMHQIKSKSDIEIPIEISKEIMDNYMSYPRIIASLAEKSCRLHANSTVAPVGSIAERDEWFE